MRKLILLILLLICFAAQAQTPARVVRGKLTDPHDGSPLPGVNVVIKGTTIGTVTDVNGNYMIEAPIGSTLVFSFIGYATRELPVTADTGDENAPGTQKRFSHRIPDDPEKTLSPYFFVMSDNPDVDQMPLKSTSASVNIAGVMADVTVSQVYVNSGKNTLEAIYIFPGSTRAAVYGMSMTIGKRKIEAQIREKKQARHDYEAAKKEGKSASLLEQSRPNIFQMNVANILPGDTITVKLKYTELLLPVDGTYEFVYPTVVGPRYSEIPDDQQHQSEQWVENPYQKEGESPFYTFDFNMILNTGIPVQKVTSPSHKVNIQFEDRSRAKITLDQSEAYGGNRDVIMRYRLRGGQVESGLLLHPRSDENFFLLMVEPPEAPTPEQIPAREYIFIVDVSGSMHGFPIEVSKTLMRNLIGNLRHDDRFNVMLFESDNSMLFPSSVRATRDNVDIATAMLGRQSGGGGTRLLNALEKALSIEKQEKFSRTFVVVTDGYVTVEREAFNMIRSNLGEANLFAFGIGSSVNRHLIEGLAHAGMGEPFVVTNTSEANQIGTKFRDYIEKPVLTGIKVDYQNFSAYDVDPVSVPDVFAERPIIIYGKYKDALKGSIRISGYSGATLWEKRIDLSSATKENNEALRYLWARNRIKYLDDYAHYYEDEGGRSGKDDRDKEVTALGLKYNLLTQYTSFIAIDKEIRNPSGQSVDVKQPLPLPEGVSDYAIGMQGSLSGLSLSPDVQALSEVVVIGYGSVLKKDVTGTVQVVENSALQTQQTIPAALQGRVSGVYVQQNHGSPGVASSVRIRGNNSISGFPSPLYVVDGVVLDMTDMPSNNSGIGGTQRIDDINPDDIESLQVFKGASASAIYGSRGTNGVIVITTKKPKNFHRELSFSSSLEVTRANKLPKLQKEYAQGSPEGGEAIWKGPDSNETFSWGPALSQLRFDGSAYDFDKNGRLSNSANGPMANAYDPYRIFGTGVKFANHLRVTTGREFSKSGVSIGHQKHTGILQGAEKQILQGSLFHERVIRKLTLGTNNFFSLQERQSALSGNTGSSVMYGLLTTPPTFDNSNGMGRKDAFANESSYLLSDGTARSFAPGVIENPYGSLIRNTAGGTTKRGMPSIYANFHALRWLEFKTRASADLYNDEMLVGLDLNSAASPVGMFYDRKEQYRSGTLEALVDIRRDFLNGNLKTKALFGYNYLRSRRAITRMEAKGLQESGRFTEDNANSVLINNLDVDLLNRRFFSQIGFGYRDLISVDLTSVRENTSALKMNIHSESAGVSFNYSDMSFIRDLELFSEGRIFGSVSTFQREAPLFGDPTMRVQSLYEPTSFLPERILYTLNGLAPERVSSVETGIEMQFFQNRMGFSASAYRNRTRDGYIPEFNSVGATLKNGLAVQTHGFDLDVDATPVSRDIRWNLKLHYSRYRSMVQALPDGKERIALAGFGEASSSLVVGQPYGVLTGTRYLRNAAGEKVIGDDGFPLVDASIGVLGDPNPDWTMGVENNFHYKNFSAGFLFDIKHGGRMWNGTSNTMNYYGTSALTGEQRNTIGYIFEGVKSDGEPNDVSVDFANPQNGLSGNRWVRYGKAGVGEDAIEDASWIRLRNVSLSYDFSAHTASSLRLKKLSLTFTATNLLLFTKYNGIDPDTNLSAGNGRGLDYFNLPNVRSFGVGLRAGL
jgi:TonB-linked SusC/RagA family outer membrane protein